MDDIELVEPGGRLPKKRIVAAARWDSAPIRRAVRKARAEGRLIDLTFGHACHWVFFMDTGHVVLGARGSDDQVES